MEEHISKWPQLNPDQLSKHLKESQKSDEETRVLANLDRLSVPLSVCRARGQMGGSGRTGLMIFKC